MFEMNLKQHETIGSNRHRIRFPNLIRAGKSLGFWFLSFLIQSNLYYRLENWHSLHREIGTQNLLFLQLRRLQGIPGCQIFWKILKKLPPFSIFEH